MTDTQHPASVADLATGSWRLAPESSTVMFEVRTLWGLVAVKGRFERFEATLCMASRPAISLVIDAASLNTKLGPRDRHLRSKDFFDVERNPEVRFISELALLGDDTLELNGELHAGGAAIPLGLSAAVRACEGGLKVEAITHVDHHELGMTWNPLGVVRIPSKLVVRGRVLPATAADEAGR